MSHNSMDMVNHPPHYNQGKIEVIEAIEDWKLNYHRGSAVKYIARAGKKDITKEIEDLEKAEWYLKRELEKLKAQKEKRDTVKPNQMVLPFVDNRVSDFIFLGEWQLIDLEESGEKMAFIPDDQARATIELNQFGQKDQIVVRLHR